jgi:hypothetical protein
VDEPKYQMSPITHAHYAPGLTITIPLLFCTKKTIRRKEPRSRIDSNQSAGPAGKSA